ncbi:hypothetical protein JCM10207_007799 [Rhodosporidiobolus poonsookiae]
MAYSRTPLHNPLVRLPAGPRTPSHIPVALLPLTSQRNAHIVRLYNLLVHLLSLPPTSSTSTQSVRAWRALASCREVHLATLWRLGSAVLEHTRERSAEDDEDGEEEQRWRARRRADWLKVCQEGREDKVDKFAEYALALVAAGRPEFALDELEAYLDNQPYRDSITLNTLAGQLALLVSQPAPFAHGARRPPSSDSSDSDDDARMSPAQRRASIGKDPAVGTEADYAPLLRAIAHTSPAMLSKATERFKRAVRLEERVAQEAERELPVKGEADRWLSLIRQFTDKTSSREASPA